MIQHPQKENKNRYAKLIAWLYQFILFFDLPRFRKGLIIWFVQTYQNIKNWQWSAISLSLATAAVFWIFHQLNQDHSANLKFPVTVEYAREDIVTVKPPPASVLLNVTGYGWVLLSKSFGFNKEQVKIELEEPLKQKVLTAEEIKLAAAANIKSDIAINRAVKAPITFDYDTITKKKVALVMDRKSIDLAPRYWVSGKINISPSHIWVTGTSQRLSRLSDTLELAFGTNTPLNSPYYGQVAVQGDFNRFVTPDQKTVHVDFDVNAYKEQEAVAKLKLKNFPKRGYRIKPNFGLYKFYTGLDTELDFKDTLIIELDYQKMLPDSTIIPNDQDSVNLFNYSIMPKNFKIVRE